MSVFLSKQEAQALLRPGMIVRIRHYNPAANETYLKLSAAALFSDTMGMETIHMRGTKLTRAGLPKADQGRPNTVVKLAQIVGLEAP